MKRLLLTLMFGLTLIVLVNNFPEGGMGGRMLSQARYAHLITRPADEKIRVPVRTVTKKQIADTWQATRRADRKHQGQDIFAPKGTPIHSATEGYVIRVGENSLGGRTVSVLGAGGRVYYYAHLDSYGADIAEGDFVSPETVLGYVGNTGNARGTPPHLHFGVYSMTGPIDPLTLF